MTIQTIADITGDNAKHALAADKTVGARRLWLTAHGSTNVRFGDFTDVASGRGVELPQDQTVVFSASDADATDRIMLGQVGVYVPAGSSVSVTYGV